MILCASSLTNPNITPSRTASKAVGATDGQCLRAPASRPHPPDRMILYASFLTIPTITPSRTASKAVGSTDGQCLRAPVSRPHPPDRMILYASFLTIPTITPSRTASKAVGSTDGQCLRAPVSRPPTSQHLQSGTRRAVSAATVNALYAPHQVARIRTRSVVVDGVPYIFNRGDAPLLPLWEKGPGDEGYKPSAFAPQFRTSLPGMHLEVSCMILKP